LEKLAIGKVRLRRIVLPGLAGNSDNDGADNEKVHLYRG